MADLTVQVTQADYNKHFPVGNLLYFVEDNNSLPSWFTEEGKAFDIDTTETQNGALILIAEKKLGNGAWIIDPQGNSLSINVEVI